MKRSKSVKLNNPFATKSLKSSVDLAKRIKKTEKKFCAGKGA